MQNTWIVKTTLRNDLSKDIDFGELLLEWFAGSRSPNFRYVGYYLPTLFFASTIGVKTTNPCNILPVRLLKRKWWIWSQLKWDLCYHTMISWVFIRSTPHPGFQSPPELLHFYLVGNPELNLHLLLLLGILIQGIHAFFCYTSDHLEMVVLPLPAKKNETIRNFTSPMFISLQRIRRLVFFFPLEFLTCNENPRETNSKFAPEKWCLEDKPFPFGMAYFQGIR